MKGINRKNCLASLRCSPLDNFIKRRDSDDDEDYDDDDDEF